MHTAAALFMLAVTLHAIGGVAAPIATRANKLPSPVSNIATRSTDLNAMMHWKADDPPVEEPESTSTAMVEIPKRTTDLGAMMTWGVDKSPSTEDLTIASTPATVNVN